MELARNRGDYKILNILVGDAQPVVGIVGVMGRFGREICASFPVSITGGVSMAEDFNNSQYF